MKYDADIMLAFLEEIAEYLPQFRGHLSKLEVKSKDREALDECYRLSHTIKGTAAMMDLNEISQQGSAMEQALLPVVEKKTPYTHDIGTLLRDRVDRVDLLLAKVRQQYEAEPFQPMPAPLPSPVVALPQPEPVTRAHDGGFSLDFDFEEDLASLPGFATEVKPASAPTPQPPSNRPLPQPEPLLPFALPPDFDPGQAFVSPETPPFNPAQLDPPLPDATAYSSKLSFDQFEPKLENALPGLGEINELELNDFDLPNWISASPSPVAEPRPAVAFDPNLEDLAGIEKFSFKDVPLTPPDQAQPGENITRLSQPEPGLTGLEGEALPPEPGVSELDLLASFGVADYQPSVAFADFGRDLQYRVGSELSYSSETDRPDDFSDAADLLAQFDNEPGRLVSPEAYFEAAPSAALSSRELPPPVADAAKSVEVEGSLPTFDLATSALPPVNQSSSLEAKAVARSSLEDLPPLPEFNFEVDFASEAPLPQTARPEPKVTIIPAMAEDPIMAGGSKAEQSELEVAAFAEAEARLEGEETEGDFDMGVLWLAEAQEDIDRLQKFVSELVEGQDNRPEAEKIKEIATRLRKGADMMDLEAIARQVGIIETAADEVMAGQLKPYMSGSDIFNYELANLMAQLAPYQEGAKAYLSNVEAEQAAALVASAAIAAPVQDSGARQLAEAEKLEKLEPATAVAPTQLASPPPGVEVDAELAEVFATEAAEHIQNLDTRLAQLERNPANRELLREIRRTAHTLKGSAAMVGFNIISQTAHLMEDLLDRLFDGTLAVTEEVVELLFNTFNAIDNMVRGLSHARPEDPTKLEMLRPQYAALLSGVPMEEQGAGGIVIFEKRAMPAPATIRAAQAAPLAPARAVAEEEMAAIEAAQAQQAAQEQAELAPHLAPTSNVGLNAFDSEIGVRVPIKRLDGMMNQVGELIINRTVLERRNQILAHTVEELALSIKRLQRVSRELETRYEVELLKNSASPLMSTVTPYRIGGGNGGSSLGTTSEEFPYGSDYLKSVAPAPEFDSLEMDQYTEFHTLSREMSETVADLAAAQRELDNLRSDLENVTIGQSRITDDLQDKLVKVRLVPVANLTPRLYRTVRTLAASQNKEIEFVVSGENTQVDKTIFEEIGDPLLHIIRNAVDHGIESPPQRLLRGKPEKGTISFTARNEGSQVVIEVRDDGTGLMLEDIRQKAIERGFLKAQARPSREEIYDLIFLPGFSTSLTISEISGRGIGMDVVRSNIVKLKGTVEVESEEGKGTTFIIRLPTTLAITRALLVRAGGYNYAVPLNVVEQTTRVEPGMLTEIGSRSVYTINNEDLPLLELNQIMRLPQQARRTLELEEEENRQSGNRREQPLLVINGAERVVLKVDKLLGQQEVVVKSLGSHIKYVPGVIGATTLGTGEVILILNMYDLVSQAMGRRVGEAAGAGVAAAGGRVAWLRIRDEIRARHGVTTPLKPPRLPERRMPLVQVVDDSLSMRKVLSSALEKAGYRVRTSKDGQEALETIQQNAPDLILMDIEMPRMDGYELTALLKGREAFYTIPIVMLTSRAGLKHRQKAEEVGADGFLVKPYKEEELLQIVGTLLERARQP